LDLELEEGSAFNLCDREDQVGGYFQYSGLKNVADVGTSLEPRKLTVQYFDCCARFCDGKGPPRSMELLQLIPSTQACIVKVIVKTFCQRMIAVWKRLKMM
jgi:hypothetical protein